MQSEGLGRGRAAVTLLVASLVMVATLPGRTVGLGLITESLIADLGIDRTEFAQLNLWATFLGAGFILISGPCLDRIGIRGTTSTILMLFAASVLWLAKLPGPGMLLVVLVLVRGLGQSSLSLSSDRDRGKNISNAASD